MMKLNNDVYTNQQFCSLKPLYVQVKKKSILCEKKNYQCEIQNLNNVK